MRKVNSIKYQAIHAVVFAVLIALPVLAQDLPKEIRGYKVYKTDISVSTSSKREKKKGPEARVKVGDPEVADLSFTGVTFELPAEMTSYDQSGHVDFLSFHDMKVNGLPVEVEEYRESFSFKKNELIALPKPARIFLGTRHMLKGAWKEMAESKKEWTVTGRVFIFGKFRKMGFNFKRVVPVDISIKIANPVLEYKAKITD